MMFLKGEVMIKSDLSPMMQHYVTMKEEYADCILMYRLGDFYEMFFEDAKIASKELNLVLTGRDCGLNERAPMCGVPAHAIDNYLSDLVSKGYKVAICEQLSAPQKGEMVKRDVVRVVTPGTVIETSLLDASKNNYIACINCEKSECGLAYLDISTGAFYAEEFKGEYLAELNDELLRVQPAEVICNQYTIDIAGGLGGVVIGSLPKFFKYFDWAFQNESATNMILKQYNIKDLKSTDIYEKKAVIGACGALFEYIKNTQKRDLTHIKPIVLLRDEAFLYLDANARKNLELITTMRDNKKKGSLLEVLDDTKTKMGARYLRTLIEQPLRNAKAINLRLNAVEELIRNVIQKEALKDILKDIIDIERVSSKLSYNTILPIDCVRLKKTLARVMDLKVVLTKFKSPLLVDINNNIADFNALIKILEDSLDEKKTIDDLSDTNLTKREKSKRVPPLIIKAGYNSQLDDYRNMRNNSLSYIQNLEVVEKQKTGLDLKINFNNVYGYFIEISKEDASKVPFRYVRKQTVSGKDRYVTEELKELENRLVDAEDLANELEKTLYENIKKILRENFKVFLKTAEQIALLDVLVSFASVSTKYNYSKPEISDSLTELDIKEGRHPVVESLNRSDNFVPNDIYLDDKDNRIMIITGPNMAGKSTYMRQTAIIVLMAQMGCFVPAKSAKIPIFDRIFTRVGASDDLAFGQSTFMVEMSEVSNILNNATDKSLVILDEVGRGTATYDGLSIAWSIMEHISKNLKCKTLFATHYHELTDLENMLEGVKNYRISVKEFNNNIIFLRKIVRGGANRSFGIEVAQLAGLPDTVIKRAKEILSLLQVNERTNLKNVCENDLPQDFERENKEDGQIKQILKDIDINNLTPFMAMEVLNNLLEIINKK